MDDRAGILVALGLSLALSHISQQNAGLVPALSWHYPGIISGPLAPWTSSRPAPIGRQRSGRISDKPIGVETKSLSTRSLSLSLQQQQLDFQLARILYFVC